MKNQETSKLNSGWVIPLCHAVLWGAALVFGAFVQLDRYIPGYKTFLSILIVNVAFMFECVLVVWELEATHEEDVIEFKGLYLQKWIFLNVASILFLVTLFLAYKTVLILYLLVFAGACLKFLVCRHSVVMENFLSPFQKNKYVSKF